MDNFNQSQMGYDKTEVNEFVDYVIKKTEENIDTIRQIGRASCRERV